MPVFIDKEELKDIGKQLEKRRGDILRERYYLVDVETSADDAEKSKPHPDILEAAVSRLGIAPASGRGS